MSSFIHYIDECLCGEKPLKIKIEVSVRDEMRAEVSRILLIFKCSANKKTDDDDDNCVFAHAVAFFANLYAIFAIILWSVGFKCQIYGVTLQKRFFLMWYSQRFHCFA